jgi:DNA-binding transcriptional LysR family regulator
MNVTFRQLQVFLEVAQCGSMLRAATALHLTPPAVSMKVKEIEKQLGLALFNRGKRRVSLSAAGEYFVGYARRVLAETREAETAIARLKGLEGGRLAVGITASMAEYFVPRILAQFHDEHPAIDVKIRVAHHRDQLAPMMDSAEVDLLVMGHRPARELVGARAEAFATNPFVFVCSPRDPIQTHGPLPITALDGRPFIVGEPGSVIRSAMERLFSRHRCTPNIGMQISSNETIKHAVMAGMGLGFLSLHSIAVELNNGLLEVLDVEGTPLTAAWNIVHLRARTLSPAAEAFRHFVITRGRANLRTHSAMLLSLAFKGRRRMARAG